MSSFTTIIQKYSNKGEKTGWTYIDIPKDLLVKLKIKGMGSRVKGSIDDVTIEKMATFPVGEGNYILAINGELRKKLGKKEGAMVKVKLQPDAAPPLQSPELLTCLEEDLIAKEHFDSLLLSHRNYFHRYVHSAKGAATKAGRIVNVINAMHRKQDFGEMIRSLKKK